MNQIQNTVVWASYGQRRSYSMVDSGSGFVTYPGRLPALTLNVGIQWQKKDGSPPKYDAPSYATSAVKQPSSAIAVVENPKNDNIVGNIWPTTVRNPQDQTNNYGQAVLALHNGRFNYLMHDGNSASSKLSRRWARCGQRNLYRSKGMWTVATEIRWTIGKRRTSNF